MDLNALIDHTNLKPNVQRADIERLCDEAAENGFASVCVNTCWVPLCAERLADKDVNVCCVVGFPLGAVATEPKAHEAAWAVANGADEVDMVINVGALLDGDDDAVRDDIKAVKEAIGDQVLKVILETGLLDDEAIVRACQLAVEAGADFVKTSTGFGHGGATVHDVALMTESVGDRAKVKASGGIHNAEEAQAMVDAGASRLGTSSGVAIAAGETVTGSH